MPILDDFVGVIEHIGHQSNCLLLSNKITLRRIPLMRM